MPFQLPAHLEKLVNNDKADDAKGLPHGAPGRGQQSNQAHHSRGKGDKHKALAAKHNRLHSRNAQLQASQLLTK